MTRVITLVLAAVVCLAAHAQPPTTPPATPPTTPATPTTPAVPQAVAPNMVVRLIQFRNTPLVVTGPEGKPNIKAGWPAPEWVPDAQKVKLLSNETLPLYLLVQNVSQKPIYAYRFMVATYDPFGDFINTVRIAAVVSLAPQATDYGRWSLKVTNPLLTQSVLVYLESVVFADDASLWRVWPDEVAPAVPSYALGIHFNPWQITPDFKELIQQQPKDAVPG